jgi:hypothetical protein
MVRNTLFNKINKHRVQMLEAGEFDCNPALWRDSFQFLHHFFLSASDPVSTQQALKLARQRVSRPEIKPNRLATVADVSLEEALGHCAWLLEEAVRLTDAEKALRWIYWVVGFTDNLPISRQADSDEAKKFRSQALSGCLLYLTANSCLSDEVTRSNINCYVEGVLTYFNLMTIEEAKRLHMPEGETFDGARK